MSIQQDLRTFVLGSTAIVDQIGKRCYYVQAPQEATVPYAVFIEIADPHMPRSFDKTESGQLALQTSVISDDRYEALLIGNLIRDRLHMYSGSMDSSTVENAMSGGVRIMPIPEEHAFQAIVESEIIYYST